MSFFGQVAVSTDGPSRLKTLPLNHVLHCLYAVFAEIHRVSGRVARLPLPQAAKALGMTVRTMSAYGTGARPVPRYVALACKGWEAEHSHG